MIIDIINKSFLLDKSQKIYLIEKLKTADSLYIQSVIWIIEEENNFMLSLLKKYKQDSNNHSIWQLKWELITKNFEKIRNLEKQEEVNCPLKSRM
jgi:hypothetical protein